MRSKFLIGGVSAILFAATTAAVASPPAEARSDAGEVTVFEAKKIITMEPSTPTARFVAVRDGLILGVADAIEELGPWTQRRAPTVDRRFAERVLMPGLIDPHVHPMQAAVMMNIPFTAPEDWDLPSGFFKGARTPEDFRARLKEEITRSKPGPVIVWGHHALFHGEINRAELDRIAPARPLIVWQRSFHEVIMNSAALKSYGLDDAARVAAALKKAKSDAQHANLAEGVFSETALPIALEMMRPQILAPEKVKAGLDGLKKMLLQNGVTTVADMATGIFADFDTEAQLIKGAFERPDNPSRIMLMPVALSVPSKVDLDAWFNGVSARYSSPRVRVDRRVKMLADGAFFAQNMMMNPPGYADGHQGKWITEPDMLGAQFNRFWRAGFDLHIHVNGDHGLDVVLDRLDALPSNRGQSITLEHLGYSTEAQNRRIARAGLMVSAQPNYIRVLGDVYARNGLGADRAATMNRLGSLEAKGVPLGLHSDFNMAPIDPLFLAWIAANRLTLEGNRKAPAERLSLDKALRAVTIEAAQVIGMDGVVGSIAAGKKADFAVLDRDPYKAGAAKLHEVGVEGVIFEGVYYPAPAQTRE